MTEVRKYLASRKDVKKAMNKALKVKESRSTDKNNEITPAAVNMLKESNAVSIVVFESLLSFIAVSKSMSSHWFSKLVQPKRVACEEVADTNELEKVDAALNSLISDKSRKFDYTIELENVNVCSKNWRQKFKISNKESRDYLGV
ncbi:hypothetical protein C1H46_012696 [Malus baccata]|uniref:Uncharacterized protein n=1 Tax=Malus baccata TaxID=106549 RepID=A0A540MSI9_MALBA|nr:hypothetical protein C1H46_012696 [Malus baccata]